MKTRLIFLIATLLPLFSFAQTAEKAGTHTYMSNGVFLVLVAVIVLLLIVIVGMAEMVKASATHKVRQKKESTGGDVKLPAILFLLFFGQSLFAQSTAAPTAVVPVQQLSPPFDYWGLGAQMFFVLMVVIAFELIIIYVLYRTGIGLLRTEKVQEKVQKETLMESKLIKSIIGEQTPEEEAAIMTDHEYDGIRELDNNLPLWWKYGFYFTIIVAVVYLLNYHVFENGLSSREEFEAEMTKAEAEVAAFNKTNAANVDENSVVQLIDANSLASGRSVFTQNCAACHGPEGQGLVGPNLTDDYWLHKGGIVDIFKSVKYGWTNKGMKSWEQDLKPIEIQQVSSFIMSLRGTNPVNPKDKEGELYVYETAQSDSTKVDSAGAVDTTKTK